MKKIGLTLLVVFTLILNCFAQDYNIEGFVKTELGIGIYNVPVTVRTLNNSYELRTDINGYYELRDIDQVESVELMTKEDSPLNGLSVIDLYLINQYRSGAITFTPYQQIAADVNRTGSISTFDIIEARKILLGVNDEFPDSPNWKFIYKDFQFDSNDPFTPDFSQQNTRLDFVGMKIGDVNGNVWPSALRGEVGSGQTRSVKPHLIFPDAALTIGQEVKIPVRISNGTWDDGYLAMQFSLGFDTEKLSFKHIESGEFEIAGEHYQTDPTQDGQIRFIHYGDEPDDLDFYPLFYLVFDALETGQLIDAVWYSDDLPTRVYNINAGTNEILEWRIAPPKFNPYINGGPGTEYSISGEVFSLLGQGIKNVEIATVELIDSSGKDSVIRVNSDENGFYQMSFPQNQISSNSGLFLEPQKYDNPMNGISVADLYLLRDMARRSSLYLEVTYSFYELIAGDLNQSGRVDVWDYFMLNNLLLGDVDSRADWGWRFILADYLPMINSWSVPSFPRVIDYSALNIPAQFNFIGLKAGDLTFNARTNGLRSTLLPQTRSITPRLVVPDLIINEGEIIKVPFYLDHVEKLAAIQFSLKIDQDKLEYVGVNSGVLTMIEEENIGLKELENGILRVVYAGEELEMVSGRALFFIEFLGKADSQLSETISLDEMPLESEVFHQLIEGGELISEKLDLVFDNTVSTNMDLKSELSLLVSPNPMSTFTQFELRNTSYSGNRSLKLYDALGQLERNIFFNGSKIDLLRGDLLPGVYFYQIVDEQGKVNLSGKLLVL